MQAYSLMLSQIEEFVNWVHRRNAQARFDSLPCEIEGGRQRQEGEAVLAIRPIPVLSRPGRVHIHRQAGRS